MYKDIVIFPMARLAYGLSNHFGRRKDNNDVGYMFNDSFHVVLRTKSTTRQHFCTKKFTKPGKLFGKGGQCALSETKLFKSWRQNFLPISAWQQIALHFFRPSIALMLIEARKSFSNQIAFDNFRIWSRNSSFISLIKVFLSYFLLKCLHSHKFHCYSLLWFQCSVFQRFCCGTLSGRTILQ